jgi:hypothetical protein
MSYAVEGPTKDMNKRDLIAAFHLAAFSLNINVNNQTERST